MSHPGLDAVARARERYPSLLAIGGHPSVDMPPHVVEAAAQAASRRRLRADRGAAATLREAIADELGAELGRRSIPTGRC